MFAELINITTMPNDLKALVTRFEVHPALVVAAICTIYVVLGTAMEELSMVLLRHPDRDRGRDRADQPCCPRCRRRPCSAA